MEEADPHPVLSPSISPRLRTAGQSSDRHGHGTEGPRPHSCYSLSFWPPDGPSSVKGPATLILWTGTRTTPRSLPSTIGTTAT